MRVPCPPAPMVQRPRRLASVDGTMRVEARLNRTNDHGTVTGLAETGSWGAGAVLSNADLPQSFDRVTVGPAAIFATGQRAELPFRAGRMELGCGLDRRHRAKDSGCVRVPHGGERTTRRRRSSSNCRPGDG